MMAMLLDLAESLDPAAAIEHSQLDHHVVGLDYLNLLRTPRLTIKVYLAQPTLRPAHGLYLVHPHTHRYAFTTLVVSGIVTNTRFSRRSLESDPGIAYVKRDYDNDTREMGPATPAPLHAYSAAYRSGETYALSPQEVHTIAVEPGTILALFQGPDVLRQTSIYLPSEETAISFEGLYRRPRLSDIERLRSQLLDAI